jgi:N-acetylglutamate synthase-like GNAT family acetyltransferase
MVDADRDTMLREMAANRGCRLVKSRRRTPGVGDYGRYGLKDAGTGKEIFGFGADGLAATAEDIEAFLRKGLVADWKSSLDAAPEPAPKRRAKDATAARDREAKDAPTRSTGIPHLRVVESSRPPSSHKTKPPPPPAPPPPPQRRTVLRIREARPADAERVATLLGIETKDVAARISALRKAGEPPLVAEEEDRILGCIAWHALPLLQDKAPLGRITLLLVAPDVRRRGIGRALVEEAQARLADAGCLSIEAPAEIELAAAPDFFRRLGWTRSAYLYASKLAPDDGSAR